jgi:Leucine-rich repeat (LRR) protein
MPLSAEQRIISSANATRFDARLKEFITGLDMKEEVVDPSLTSFAEFVNLSKLKCRVDAFGEDEEAPMFNGLDPERIRELDLSGSGSLSILPKSIGQFRNLTRLNLRECNFKVMPESIGKLTNITELDLSRCGSLKTLPASIGSLIGLTKVSLQYCHFLKTLPEAFGNLTRLTNLSFRRCESLISLPETVGELTGPRHWASAAARA